ncbi:sensor histidine kinase [Roseateles albus]|uniref:histidine kinase n=1 Tax=Roseateles albus TaxID=2987525 RepID=A0ABT5KDD9_9BURK|nr:sensor histidine kinase [Roseateles albus]MDC8771943.1 sensor histidine kinase [Roseateles albus]
MRSLLMRCLTALLLALSLIGGLAVHKAAGAQTMPLPEPIARHAGEPAVTAELALANWSRADLDAWWAALRAKDGAAGKSGGLPLALQPPSDPQAWTRVQLPDLSGRPLLAPSPPAEAAFQMRWYRFRYVPEQGRWPTSVALYMPRLVTLAAAVLVRTDEGWQPVFDNQAGAREQWVRPLWALVPAALTEAQQQKMMDVVVAVPVVTGAPFSVSRVWLGAREDLEIRFQRRWWLQIGIPQATGLTLIVLGLFSLSLWARRRDEPAYFLFALLSLVWLLRNLHYHLDLPRTPAGLEWFWWLSNASLSWVMLLIFLFALRFAHRRFAQLERAMLGFVLLSALLTLPWWNDVLASPVLQHGANALVGLMTVALVLRLAWRDGSRELRMIALSLLLSLALGLHDLILLAGWAWPEHIYLLPFATLLTLASFLYAVQGRYTGALREVEMLNQQLEARLQLQSAELQAQHQRLREAERQQALLLERQRLMQDMHDGLGSSLLSAMVAVEQGSMEQDKVVEVLRECVDDLRLVIDSLEPVAHDLVALLATMRYRLGKRLQAGGLMLEWDVQDLPLLEWLEPPDALHVLRLMQEALSNVLKHARATRVRMVTRNHGRYVEIRVEDDGDGFDITSAQMGRGLKSQQRRAQRLGGSLRIDSSPGHGTRLSLRLPVKRMPPDQQTSP